MKKSRYELIVMALEDEYLYALANNTLENYPESWSFTNEKIIAGLFAPTYEIKELTKPFFNTLVLKYNK